MIEMSEIGSTIVDRNAWIDMSERLSRTIWEANGEELVNYEI
ncbi:MAG: hypothetical protein ACLPY5_11075 [Candidatus Bathyarchaeia archaeon]